jgi:hypothetical protein
LLRAFVRGPIPGLKPFEIHRDDASSVIFQAPDYRAWMDALRRVVRVESD